MHRRRTSMAQNTRHAEEIAVDFVNAVNQHIKIMKISPHLVVNIDETNVDFDMPSSSTLSRRGERTVTVHGNGSNQRAVLLLGVSMSGEKTYDVTGDIVSRGYPSEVVMSVQKKLGLTKSSSWNGSTAFGRHGFGLIRQATPI